MQLKMIQNHELVSVTNHFMLRIPVKKLTKIRFFYIAIILMV